MRTIERTEQRNASIGSTRIDIHAGAIEKQSPVAMDVARAKSKTGTEGDASIGTAATPCNEGNANRQIRLVLANAMARPAPPPANPSRMLSRRGWLITRYAGAPSAILTDVCCRRSIERISIRLATFAQTMSRTNPVTAMRIRSQSSYRWRMLVIPAPPGLRNNVCSGNFARSLALISLQCITNHCLSSTLI